MRTDKQPVTRPTEPRAPMAALSPSSKTLTGGGGGGGVVEWREGRLAVPISDLPLPQQQPPEGQRPPPSLRPPPHPPRHRPFPLAHRRETAAARCTSHESPIVPSPYRVARGPGGPREADEGRTRGTARSEVQWCQTSRLPRGRNLGGWVVTNGTSHGCCAPAIAASSPALRSVAQ